MKTIEYIVDLLRDTIPEVKIEPYAVDIDSKDAIIYNFTPLSDNGNVRSDRLEIHIIAKDLDNAFDYDTRVRKVLLTLGDETLNSNNILQSEISGGGSLEDAATGYKHLITYYTVISKGSRYYGT